MTMSNDAAVDTATEQAPGDQSVRVRYLKPEEVAALVVRMRAAGRYGARDAAMVLLAYQHGLRVSELCALTRDDVDLKAGTIRIARRKGSVGAVHPLTGAGMRALRDVMTSSQWIFVNERGTPVSTAGFRDTLRRHAPGIHPHMLRHACGYKLANDGTDLLLIAAYLGHKDVRNTMRYTVVDSRRFRGLF